MNKKDFYSTVEIICCDLYGVNIPSTQSSYNDWLEYSRLTEESCSWEYKNNIEKWNKKLFKPIKKIEHAKKLWKQRKEECDKCISYMKENYTQIQHSAGLLGNLKKKELNVRMSVSVINDAFNIYNETAGSKLQQVLLDDTEASLNLFDELSNNL